MKRNKMKVIIVERDCENPFTARGPMIWEQYTYHLDHEVIARAEGLAKTGQYGKVWVAKLDFGTAIEVKPEGNEELWKDDTE